MIMFYRSIIDKDTINSHSHASQSFTVTAALLDNVTNVSQSVCAVCLLWRLLTNIMTWLWHPWQNEQNSNNLLQ